MKPQNFLFYIPGTTPPLDYDQLKKLENPPEDVIVRDCKANASLGKMRTATALLKFFQ